MVEIKEEDVFCTTESLVASCNRLLYKKGVLARPKGERRSESELRKCFIISIIDYFLEDEDGKERIKDGMFSVFYEKDDLKIKWADVISSGDEDLDVHLDLKCIYKEERKHLSISEGWFLFDYLYCGKTTRNCRSFSLLGRLRKRYGADFAVKGDEK